MENQEFDLSKVKEMYEKAGTIPKIINNKAVITKDIKECIDYVSKYFFPLKSGGHMMIQKKKLEFYDDKSIRSTYFKRMPIEISKWYFTEYLTLYSTISDINAPKIERDNINLCDGILHKNVKKYTEYSKEIKECANLMLTFIKEVLCSSDDKVYEFYLKWISNMCKGKKNDVIIYQKSLEGVGKSTLWEFIMKYVLGNQICIKSNADPLRTSNNKLLSGMLLVLFEELPTFSSNEWSAVSSKLKDMATSNMCIYSDKYLKSYEAKNINNYIINTNVEAIKNAEGRRYFIPTISTKRIKDHKYFGNIRNKCFNNEVGEAFYSYMMDIDTENWNAQANMPETTNKLNIIASRLDSIYLFLKDCYILRRKGINAKTAVLYSQYKKYCEENEKKTTGKHEFFIKLGEININHERSGNFQKYIVKYSTLQEIADKFNWIHVTDEYINEYDLNDLDNEKPKIIKIEDISECKWYKTMLNRINNKKQIKNELEEEFIRIN